MKKYKILNDCRGMDAREVLDIIMRTRGVDNIQHFLFPTKESLLPLKSLYRIEEAAFRIKQAIDSEQNIGILFDTDTDGVCAGAIITRYLKHFCENTHIFPFINEGKAHGLTGQDLKRYEGLDLLIIVDSLDGDVRAYKELKQKEVDIVILDHHAIKETIPYDDFTILVSSQRFYENKELSGAGVVWKFCKYMDGILNTDYADQYLDLAACGLVADLVDMRSLENRYLVYSGLKNLQNPAIKKLLGSYEFNSTAITFSVAPLINASNRVGQNEVAMEAFLADEKESLAEHIHALKDCKEMQKEEVDALFIKAVADCEKQTNKKAMVVFIESQFGINGYLGSKLLDKYERPVLVLKDFGDTYKGSMRACGVPDFRKICNDSGLAIATGHELASGIEIKKENYEQFVNYLEEVLPNDLRKSEEMTVDIQLDITDITRSMVDMIKKIDFVSGENFKQIRVYIDRIEDYEVGQMSSYKHLSIKPNDYLYIIQWNYNGSFEDMEDNSLLGVELYAVCTLDSGFFGRRFVLKAICDELEEARYVSKTDYGDYS